jgi:hypothetical protein
VLEVFYVGLLVLASLLVAWAGGYVVYRLFKSQR